MLFAYCVRYSYILVLMPLLRLTVYITFVIIAYYQKSYFVYLINSAASALYWATAYARDCRLQQPVHSLCIFMESVLWNVKSAPISGFSNRKG